MRSWQGQTTFLNLQTFQAKPYQSYFRELMMHICSSSQLRPDDYQAHIYGCAMFHKPPKLFFQSPQAPGFHTLKSLSAILFLLQSSF